MKVPFVKKKIKSYSSVLGQFRNAINDMKEIVNREAQSVGNLQVKKEEIDRQIVVADQEIRDCQTAIQNIDNMFPGLNREVAETE